MANANVNALGQSDLNAFLYAEIGTDANGLAVTMLSVLARMGFDPWTEASKLAALPKSDAAESLTRMIARLPDSRAVADRLTGLLPSRPVLGLSTAGLPKASHWLPRERWPLALAAAALLLACAVWLAS